MARAHAPPQAIAFAFREGNTAAVPVLVTNRGLVVSVSGVWQMRCNEAYGVNTSARPSILETPDGSTLVLGTTAGVLQTPDLACSLQDISPVPNSGMSSSLLSAYLTPSDQPGHMLVATGNDPTAQNALYLTEDYGANWSKVSDNAQGEWFTSLAVAPSDSSRLYGVLAHVDMATSKLASSWASSDDGGATWQSHAIDQNLEIIGAHPTKPDIVFAQERTDDTTEHRRLWRSTDAGASFEMVMETKSRLTDIVQAPGGTALWLGGELDTGLLGSSDDGATFTQVTDGGIAAAHVLRWHDGKLWLSGNRFVNVEGVWSTDATGSDWTELLTFEKVASAVACTSSDAEAMCQAEWEDWFSELHPYGVDGGVGDGGSDAGGEGGVASSDGGAGDAGATGVDGGSSTKATSSSGCSLSPRHASRSAIAIWSGLLAGVFLFRRRRRTHS